MKDKQATKLCKYCKTEIPAGAKVCPNCRKKQGSPLKWVVIAAVIAAALLLLGGPDGKETATAAASATAAATAEPVTYTAAAVDDMMALLQENALNASDTYKGQYLEITGRLGVIDSSGKYITLYPVNDQFALTGVQCYLKQDDQKPAVADMKTGDTVTLRGKCTDVGEILGYSLDIDSIG